MSTRRRTLLAGLAAASVALSLTGCAGTATTTGPSASGGSAAGDVKVVATTQMLGDITRQITDCAGGTTTTLMPPGVDPHEFSLSSQQATELVKAKLVVINGLELEHGIEDVLDNAQKDGATIFSVADKLDPIPFAHDEHEADAHEASATADASASPTEEEHEHGSQDPHFWLDLQRGAKAATVIGGELATATGNQKYTECATTVHDKLLEVDKQVEQTLAKVPADRRVLITDHEAFGYFSKRYHFEVAGVVVPGGSTSAETSSQQVADLVKVIKEKKIHAIFSNTTVNPKLVETVAAEVGGDVKVVPLFVESTDEKAGVKTYADMLTRDATLIADALSQG